MTISVIIATYNRAALLDDCLSHMGRQPLDGDEVIVVDNGSTDGTFDVVARHRSSLPALTYLSENRPGKSHALAAGVARARGDILAFTDDDVNVDDNWLSAIRRAMAGTRVALVGGPVAPRWERAAPRWLRRSAERYGRLTAPLALLNYGPVPAALGSRTFLGANLAVTREALDAVGGFAVHLGKRRGTLLSGEDHDFCRRVQAAGFRAEYRPEATVRHWVPAERMRRGYFLNWFYWSGITHAALDDGADSGHSAGGVPFYLIRRFIQGGLLAILAGACGRQDLAVEHAVDCAFAAGYAAHRWGYVEVVPRPAAAAREAA